MNKTNKTICFCIIFLILILIIIYLQKKKKEKKSFGSWLSGAAGTVAGGVGDAVDWSEGAVDTLAGAGSSVLDDVVSFGVGLGVDLRDCAVDVVNVLAGGNQENTCDSTPSFHINSSKTMDYRSSKIFGTKYQWYTPQGFALGSEFCYLAAYYVTGSCPDWEKVENKTSKVFKIKLSTKTLVKVYNLVDQANGSHVGGMSLIEETNQFFIASRQKSDSVGTDGICVYSMDAADQDPKEEVDVTHTKVYKYTTYCPNSNCLGTKAPSYMFFDKRNSLLWYGRYDKSTKAPASICANPVTISGGSAKLGVNNPEYTYILPTNNIQGMAVVQTTSTLVIYLSQSSGANNSKIFRWMPDTDEWGLVAQGWGGLQNLDFDSNNKLWGVTEAGSKYYQSTEVACGGAPPWPSHPGYIYAEIQVPDLPKPLDAVIFNADTDKYYFFDGDSYYSKEKGSSKPIKGPYPIKDDWGGLPINNLDGALYNADTAKYYFYKGSQYYSKEKGSSNNVEGPFNLSSLGLPGDLDAVMYNADTDKYYYFKNGKYYKKLKGSGEKAEGPWNIGGSGPSTGLPSKMNINSSIYNSDTNKYYYFKDDKYYERDSGAETASGPKPMTDWGGLSIF